jgi:hypothetical protein
MTYPYLAQATRHRLLGLAGAVMLAVSVGACGSSPLASVPMSPSALPSSGSALETSDAATASEGWATLGKGNDKGKGKPGDDTGEDTGDDDGKGKDREKEKEKERAPADPVSAAVEFEGAIVTATGTCPAKTVTVGTRSFVTNAATEYNGGTCAELVAAAVVKVRATTQTDGTLLATKVEFEDADAGEDDDGDEDDQDSRNPHDGPGPFEGTVSSFNGICPAVAFNLKGMEIVTTEATTYVGGTCATLQPNVHVVVTGTREGETRTITATEIEITLTH